MAKNKKTSFLSAPQPTKQPGQRSTDISDLFLTRFTPPWGRPPSLPAHNWRTWVINQPVAVNCRETLISSLLSLDWKITPRNMEYRDELEPTIRHYTRLLERGGDYPELSLDYSGLLEWIIGDMLDLPFGGAAEIGRRNDSPNGRVMWTRPLDAGTLYPTLNAETPVVQYYSGFDAVAFPAHAISRVYMSPLQNLWREGWGMAPPEKIYFALDLLNRGDKYYANLLMDIPTVGILDLGDMDATSAKEWIEAFRTFANNITESFKIPVLYEHTTKTEFIPLGKVPNDIMFDRITLKYAALVCSAYGLTLSDIGIQSASASGETLAGAIRNERKTNRTGFARVKRKWTSFVNQMLPDSLQFNLIDYDDEKTINQGRARLATATAFNTLVAMGAFSVQEIRSQMIQDGLMDISIPDTLPPNAQPRETGKLPERPGLLPDKQAPSLGGEGEIKSLKFKPKSKAANILRDVLTQITPQIVSRIVGVQEDDYVILKADIQNSLFDELDGFEFQKTIDQLLTGKSIGTMSFDENGELSDKTKNKYEDGLAAFVGRAAIYAASEEILSEMGKTTFDISEKFDYGYIVDRVLEKFLPKLSNYALAYANLLRDSENQSQKQEMTHE